MSHRLTAITVVLVLGISCGGAGTPELPADPREAQPAPPVEPPGPPEEIGPAASLTADRRHLLSALETAKQRWRAISPRAYRLIVSKECFCDSGTPFESRVKDGVVVAAAGGVRSGGRRVEPELRTVDMLFAEAERLIRSNVDDIMVAFDDQFGYPSFIAIDRWRDTADDERRWRAQLTVVQ